MTGFVCGKDCERGVFGFGRVLGCGAVRVIDRKDGFRIGMGKFQFAFSSAGANLCRHDSQGGEVINATLAANLCKPFLTLNPT